MFDVDIRLTLYKRIASAKNSNALKELQVEFIDRFGLLPQATKNLFAIAEFKLKAEKLGINKIKGGTNKGYIEFIDQPKVEPLTIIQLIQKHPNTYKLAGTNKLKFDFGELATPEALIENLERLLKLLK